MSRFNAALACIATVLAIALLFLSLPAFAHDIYTGLKDWHQTLCCGGSDCEPTQVRVEEGGASFYSTRYNRWVFVPKSIITYETVPGDHTGADGHWCGFQRLQQGAKPPTNGPDHQLGTYCAFVSVGGT